MSLDLSNYVMVGRYDLPEPTRTTAPTGSLLAQEASSVTYNWDTDSLFVIGDGGTSIVQVSKTGQLIDSMTLAKGSSPQGTEFYDTEGMTYIGNGQFVMTEERYRTAVLFTYTPDTTLTRADTKTVDLGTDIGNIGLEGVTYDPASGGFVFVKEKTPEGIFQTTIDFNAGTASNGSATTVNSTNLFDPAKVGTTDFSDVYALSSNSTYLGTTDQDKLLVLSQESGKVVELDRAGNVISTLTLQAPTTSTGLSIADMTVEGVTMDTAGNLYLVAENGGGDSNHPQLWVFSASTTPNTAPTALSLTNALTSILENTNTSARVKVADLVLTDDGLGTNNYSVSGADAASFEVDSTGLYIKAGTTIDYETKTSYSVTVNVDDPAVGNTPDASTNYTLNVTDVVNEGGANAGVRITEVAPWSSGNSPSNIAADWFELTNVGSTAVDVTGWKMDDDSYGTAKVPMTGITSIAPGESVIFIEASSSLTSTQIATLKANFAALWNLPSSVQIGTYTGSGVGLGTGGDAVNVFDASNNLKASVTFGASTTTAPFKTFDNAAGLNATDTTNHVSISTLSATGVHGAYAINPSAGQEIGSPGTVGGVAAPVNKAPTAIGLSGEITQIAENTSTATHIKVASVIVTDDGLGTNTLSVSGADAQYFEVDSTGLYIKAGTVLDYEAKSSYAVTVNVDDTTIGATPDASVGFTLNLTDVAEANVKITEVAPWSSGNSPVAADWFEVTNTGTAALDITGWKMDDNSNSFANSVPLSGITSVAAGESVIFIEAPSGATPTQIAALKASFLSTWFGDNVPTGLQIGTYSGAGVGLSTGGDAVNLYDASGVLQANVAFGSSTTAAPFKSFDNAAGLNNTTISTLSSAGTNAAFAASSDHNEIGSPGEIVHVNHAPTANDDTGTALVEDSVLSATGNVLTNDRDTDLPRSVGEALHVAGARAGGEAAGGSLTAVSGATVVHGTYGDLTINLDGSYSYALNNSSAAVQNLTKGQQVSDLFTYQVADAHGATDTAQLNFGITGAAEMYTLQLLSFSDQEGGQESVNTAYRLAGLVQGFKAQVANTLTISGGDTFIPGPFNAAGTDSSIGAVVPGANNAPARPDVAIQNAIGIDAAAIGNHEFDLGSSVLNSAIGAASASSNGGTAWSGALYPYLSANLDVSTDSFLSGKYVNTVASSALETTTQLAGKIAPSAVKNVGGQNIGIIGLTPQNLKFLSSPSGATIKGDPNGVIDVALAVSQVQAAVDELTAKGVNKIILTTDSNNPDFDIAVANGVHGVDLVVAGGSHQQFGDANDTPLPGQSFDNTLPVVTTDADGNTVLVVSTEDEYQYLNRLVVNFDENGHIDASLLDNTVNGAYASTDANVAVAWNTTTDNLATTAYAAGTTASKVKAITDAIQSVIIAKDGNVFGYSNVYLEGDRAQVRFQETNLGDLSADANAAAARQALGLSDASPLISIKNGGGIRSSIGFVQEDGTKVANLANPDAGKPAGAISQLDVENALRFNNALMTFTTTAQGLVNILNSGNALVKGQGGFVQIGGVQFSYDPTKAAGSRVQDVALVDGNGNKIAVIADNGVVNPNAPALIHGIVLNFTANGGDGYAFKANADNFQYVKGDGTLSAVVDESLDFTSATTIATYTGSATNLLGEQKVMEDYVAGHFGTPANAFNLADTTEANDLRIQNQAVRADTVLSGEFIPLLTSGHAFTANENQTVAAQISAIDGNNDTLTYSITGGADADLFTINAVTGLISFKAAPDYEAPADAGHDNVYNIDIAVGDGKSVAEDSITIAVANVNEAPVITSNGGGDTASVNVAENTKAVTTVTATDVDSASVSYAIAGGADAALFQIDAATGALSFKVAPNYEVAADADHNNVYDVVVRASDGSLTDDQAISVAVTDVADTHSSQSPYLLSSQSNVSIQAIITTGDATSKVGGGTYLFGGIPDGIGAFDNGDGTITVLVNQEIGNTLGTVRADGAKGAYVSQLVIDKATLSVISGQDAIQHLKLWDAGTHSFVDSTLALNRFCSADLPAQSALYNAATGLGSQAKIFFTGEESGTEGRQLGVVVTGNEAGTTYDLPWLGKFAHENAVANAFSGDKTIVLGTDDNSGAASGRQGQVYVYVGTKTNSGTEVDKAGLTNGTLYGFKVPGLAQELETTNLQNVHFDLAALGDVSGLTGAQLDSNSRTAGVTDFLRPEDIAWDPTNAARGYFVTTDNVASNGTSTGFHSRLYQFTFTDINHPELGGTISAVLDGTEGQVMFDNITVGSDGRVTLCEDPGNNVRIGRVWQYDPVADKLTEIAHHDPALFLQNADPLQPGYTPNPAKYQTQDEESSGVLDVTGLLGDANHRVYLIDTQNHKGATGPNAAELVEGGQLQLMTITNNAPVISSNGGGATAAISLAENGTAVTTVTATDDATDTATFAITGGADAALFTIDAKTGVLSFKAAPNYEAPADADHNNVYDVVVAATDGLLSDSQTLAVTVTDVNEAPVFTSPHAFTAAENQTAAAQLAATDDDGNTLTYTITGGADAALFTINAATGAILFKTAPDFEAPSDAGKDGVYNLDVAVDDGHGLVGEDSITISLTNVVENKSFIGTNQADVFTATSDDNWTVQAKGGADRITTLGGADHIFGGNGNDIISTGAGDDIIEVSRNGGFDSIDGGAGFDVLMANQSNTVIGLSAVSGIERITGAGFTGVSIGGTAGNDVFDFTNTQLIDITAIDGGAGNDVIKGSAGDDRIIGGRGMDILSGGGGNDVFVYENRLDSGLLTNADHILDFGAGDVIDLSAIDANGSISGNQAFTFIGTAAFTGLGQLRIGLDQGHVALFGNILGTLDPDFEIVLDNNFQINASHIIL